MSSLPTPPRYIVLPEEVIEQAFAPDKPRRALLASFTRILSLAWEAKYQQTPPLDELELIAFLKLSRRQYYEQKADMELLQWLRSSHPRPGFVQFTFSRFVTDKVSPGPGAENRTMSAENPSLIVGESLNSILNSESTPLVKGNGSAENRTSPTVVQILQHTDLLFDGAVVLSKGIEDRDPQQVLAWCAYAYSLKSKLAGPGGLVRNRLKDREPAPTMAFEQWREILPCDFLESLGLVEYTCEACQAKFKKMVELTDHAAAHPKLYSCPLCEKTFTEEQDLDSHIAQDHKPKALIIDESVTQCIDGHRSAAQAWQMVLGQLQMEMPRVSFDSWVRDSKAVCFDGNVLNIGVRNAYARDWLENRLASTVKRLLVGILNASVEVVFVVAEVEG
jgi:hypothetical protein